MIAQNQATSTEFGMPRQHHHLRRDRGLGLALARIGPALDELLST